MDRRKWSVVVFAIQTGVRRLEQFRLRQTDLQFERRMVGGVEQEVAVAHVRTSKTGKGRTVGLNPTAAAISQLWIREYPGSEYLFFPDRVGPRLNVANTITRQLVQLARGLGLVGIVWHSLRHTAACRALRAGASVRDVQRFLGHTSITQTERYLHWTDQDTWTAALAVCS